MKFINLIGFTILIPGTVAGYVPYMLFIVYNQKFEIGIFKYLGFVFIALGALFYSWSALTFLIKGEGTPAIWFTKQLKYLIGEEPKKMVSNGLYQVSRNPMYVAVLSFLLGEAILLQSIILSIYFLLVCFIFNITVIFVEEPHLKKKYGKEYEGYLERVPRWFSFFPKK